MYHRMPASLRGAQSCPQSCVAWESGSSCGLCWSCWAGDSPDKRGSSECWGCEDRTPLGPVCYAGGASRLASEPTFSIGLRGSAAHVWFSVHVPLCLLSPDGEEDPWFTSSVLALLPAKLAWCFHPSPWLGPHTPSTGQEQRLWGLWWLENAATLLPGFFFPNSY